MSIAPSTSVNAAGGDAHRETFCCRALFMVCDREEHFSASRKLLVFLKQPERINLRRNAAEVQKLFFVTTKLLHIDSVLHSETLLYAGLVELLTTTEFLGNAGLFELSLELLESALNVFALFDGYYDHSVV